ncbi:hypothetical protein V3C99_007950, partial [Haemonchus contortus]
MEIAEVEVHRRPHRDDDENEGHSGDESPPITIGGGLQTSAGGEINPLAPNALPTPVSTAAEGGAYTNPVALDNEDETAENRPSSSPPPRPPQRNQCEIEIEP